jgi:hypothetical protein
MAVVAPALRRCRSPRRELIGKIAGRATRLPCDHAECGAEYARQTGALAPWPPNEPHARPGRAGAGARWLGLSFSLEVLNPLDQRLRAPAERRVHRRFERAQRLVAGHEGFGQGVLGEVGAQAPHGAGEVAPVHADERALFCPLRCSSRPFTSGWRCRAEIEVVLLLQSSDYGHHVDKLDLRRPHFRFDSVQLP